MSHYLALLTVVSNKCNEFKISAVQQSEFDSSKQALYDLHWLPVKARINFKILIYMYNCSRGNAPGFLIDRLEKQSIKRVLRAIFLSNHI